MYYSSRDAAGNNGPPRAISNNDVLPKPVGKDDGPRKAITNDDILPKAVGKDDGPPNAVDKIDGSPGKDDSHT